MSRKKLDTTCLHFPHRESSTPGDSAAYSQHLGDAMIMVRLYGNSSLLTLRGCRAQ